MGEQPLRRAMSRVELRISFTDEEHMRLFVIEVRRGGLIDLNEGVVQTPSSDFVLTDDAGSGPWFIDPSPPQDSEGGE